MNQDAKTCQTLLWCLKIHRRRQGGFLDTFPRLPPRFIMQLILTILPSVNRLMQQSARSLLYSPPHPSFGLLVLRSASIPTFSLSLSPPRFFSPCPHLLHPPSPLPPSLVRLLHHFSPFFSLSLPNLSLFLSLSHINQFLAVFFLIIHFLLSYFPSFTSPFFFPPRFISFFQPFPRFFSSLFTPSFFVFLPLILPRYLSASLHTFFFFLLWNVWWASS